jgi:hypothetical protein
MAALRITTALALIGICAATVLRGWDLARFYATQRSAVEESRAEAARPFADEPGLAIAARETALTTSSDLANAQLAKNRRSGLAGILAMRPLSSQYWLALSWSEFIDSAWSGTNAEALAMSALTGPNEGPLMIQRGMLGFMLWASLPTELRATVAADFAGGLLFKTERLSQADQENLRRILAAKPDSERRDIGARLRGAGLDNLGVVGL